MPPRSSQGESKQGLIITLVFFVLATIGLGIGTYFGFSEQEAKDKARKEAENKLALKEADRDWYKFQALYYRTIMGHSENIDPASLGTRKDLFERGTLKGDDKEDVTKVVKGLDAKFGWDPKANKPKETYESRIAKMAADYEALDKRYQGLEKTLAETKKDLQGTNDRLQEAEKNYTANLDKFKKQNIADQENDRNEIAKLLNDYNRLATDHKAYMEKADADRNAMTKEMKKRDVEIKHWKDLLSVRNDEIAQYKLKSTEAPPSMRTDWKIVKMDRRGLNPYINLGSADKVKPQLTFSIHGVGLDGRPIVHAKGTLEVVHVLGDHLSQARITSVKDVNRDPIVEGDILYNPSWNPTIKKHVALAGIMDLTGDGRDSLPEFMRNLERQNIVVDAWLDPKDFTIKGKGITVRTDYLIIGETPEIQFSAREKNPDFYKKLDQARRQMETQAAKNGVAVISLSKYLEMIGYRLPRSIGEERPSLYNSNLRPDQAPRLGGNAQPPGMRPDR